MGNDILEQLQVNLIQGRRNEDDEGIDESLTGPGVVELVQKALDEGIEPKKILTTMTDGMKKVGEKFEAGDFFVPDMLAAAEAADAAMELLEPHLLSEGAERRGRVLMATVEGDLHDIGKNIVATMLKGAGFEVIDLGIDVPADQISEKAKEEEVDFVGLSALLTTTMGEMEKVVKKLKDEGIEAKIFVGGAPINQEFAEEIGADAYAHDGFEAVRLAREMS